MPANFESGFTVREPAWHGQGHVFDDYPSRDEAKEAAGHNWEPDERPVYALSSLALDSEGNEVGEYEVIDGFKQIVRSDTGATLHIGSDAFVTIGNNDQYDILETLLDEPNLNLVTGGVLDGGRQTYLLAQLDEPFQVVNDPSTYYSYLAILNRHDGKGACRAQPTNIRVVCQNTFEASTLEGDASGHVYKFIHLGDWRKRVEEAKGALKGLRDEQAAWIELATDLSSVKVTKAQTKEFVDLFIPAPPDALTTDRVKANIERDRANLHGILNSPTCDGINDTVYGLVQAAGEYLDHVRTFRTAETHLKRSLITREPLKRKALVLARDVAGVAG